MARIRTIKPEFWTDEKIGTLSLQSRLLFIALWNFSDDFGVLKGSPLLLKAQILPYDYDIKLEDFVKWLNTLSDKGLIIFFKYKEEQFIYIKNFLSHQKIDKPSKPIIDFDTLSRILDEYSTNTPASNSNSNSKGIVSSNRIGIGKKSDAFSPPSFEDICSYFELKKNIEWGAEKIKIQAQKFFDHYESNGWHVGKVKMASWKSAASGWINRDNEFESKKINNNSTQNGIKPKSRIQQLAELGESKLSKNK